MSEKIQSQLGRRLREARERQGIPIAQAAAETKILQRYLLALEEGDYHHLPGDVYARGFIRNYAQYLDLPSEEMVEMYRAERGGSAPIRIVTAAPPKTQSCLAPSVFVVFFLVAILGVGAYLVANALGLTTSDDQFAMMTTTATIATPDALPTATIGPTNVAAGQTPLAETTPVTSTAGGNPTSPTPEGPLVVEVSVVNTESWMRIIVDGRVQVEGTRAAGWSDRFVAQREIRVRAGNSGAVQVSVNGQPPSVMGQAWRVREQTFTP